MECLTEFTCSVFVDGELPAGELRQVEDHLELCLSCRTMAAALRDENRFLVHCFQEIDEIDLMEAAPKAPQSQQAPASAAPVARPIDIAKFGGVLAGVAALVRLAMSSPDDFALPASPVSLDWLDLSSLSGRLNWLLSGASFVASEGVSRMMSLVNSLSLVAVLLLILAGVVMLVRRSIGKSAMVATLAALGTILLMVAAPPSGYAMEVRNDAGDKEAVVPAGEVVDDNLIISGDTVIIDGTVNGDVIALGRRVTINGTIKGNVLTFAQSIDVPGTVEGTIVSASQTMQLGGKVTRNAVAFGQSLTIGKDANIGGDAAEFGSEIHVNGTVARSFYGFGLADISGSIGRNVVFSGATISLLPTARIAGNFTAEVSQAEAVHIVPGAVIGGKQTIELPKPGPNKYATFGFYFSEMFHVARAFVTGMIFLLLFPRLRRVNLYEAVSVLKSGGIGFLAVVAMPVAALILAITFIGIPVAVVGFVAWLLGLYLAKILIANFVGRTLLLSDSDRISAVALNLFVGLLLIFIAINLPFIGGLIHFLLVLIGFGALVMNLYGSPQAEPGSGI